MKEAGIKIDPGQTSSGAVLGTCAIGLALGYSVIGLSTFSVFVVPLQKTFGWGRGEISLAYTIMSYAVAVLSPIAGMMIDRFGVRRVVLPSMVGFGLIFATLALQSGQLWIYYLTYVGLAISGVGTAPPSYARMLVQWFVHRRGFALGLALSGVGVGTALVPLFVQFWVRFGGWRAGYLAMAALVLFVAFPVAWRYLRSPPLRWEAGEIVVPPVDVGYTLRQALRTRAFWHMVAAFPILGIFTAAMLAHLVPLMRDRGASPALASGCLTYLGAALIVGRLGTGWLLDRIFAPFVAALCAVSALTGLTVLLVGGSNIVAFAGIIFVGMGLGAELDIMSYLISRYNGLQAYGRIYGVMYGIFTLGAGLGPILMGYSFQNHGNYTAGLITLIEVTSLLLPLFLLLGSYPEWSLDTH